MKRLYLHFLFIIVLFFVLHSKVNSQDLTPEQIYEKVNNCVVVILSYDFDGKLSKQGSGVVISDKGWVVTNYHVFAECEKMEIRHNDKIISYTDIIGVDIEKDILILKIDENVFPSLTIANSENLKVGQRVYAIGSPLGMENSFSEGLISGLRNVTKKNKDYIQITAGISPGSSGGAVVNSKGELIGISTSSLEGGQNLNFAIPSGEILKISTGTFISKKYIEANNYFYKGYNAYENGNYLDAIDYYTKYINLFPDKDIGYNYRGNAYNNVNEYYKAISDYDKAIEINPEYAASYINRGIAHYNLKEYNKAISDNNRAIEINSVCAEAYYNRGTIYANLKEYNKAISDYKKAIEINSLYAEAFIGRGNVYSETQEYDKAISDYDKAIEINPVFTNAYINRGNVYTNLLDYSKAISDYDKAIEINPLDYHVYFNRGIVYTNLLDYNKAISDYNRAIEINPEDADTYYNRGIAYDDINEYYKAISDYNRAIEINPEYTYAYYNRGITYYHLNKLSKACEDMKKAYSLGLIEAFEFLQSECR